MDRIVEYSLVIDIPFNKETSREYSEDPDISIDFLEHLMNVTEGIIKRDGFISYAKFFRMLGMREQPDQPGVFFDTIEDYQIEENKDHDGYILTVYLIGGYTALPVHNRRSKHTTLQIVDDPELEATQAPDIRHTDSYFAAGKKLSQAFAKTFPNKPKKENKTLEDTAECQTGQKEISDSEESGKT